MENEELFNEFEEIQEEELKPVVDGKVDGVELAPPKEEHIEFEFGNLSSGTKKEVKLKEEDLEKIFVIEKAELAKPKLIDGEGNPIPPKPFSEKSDKKGYTTKLKIEFKDNNYISLLPNVKWYLGVNKEGKKVLNPWFRTEGLSEEDLEDRFVAETSKLYYRFCKFKNIAPGKLSKADFINELADKKVKVSQWEDIYRKEKVYRIDIVEFVE